MQCLCEVAKKYYDTIAVYIDDIAKITLHYAQVEELEEQKVAT